MADVRLENVIKRYGKVETIHGVDLDIKHGEFVVLVGPSGCGKSTLLRMIAGLEEITEGNVFIGNDCVTTWQPSKRRIAMVFQSYALYPHMSVKENMSFGLEVTGSPRNVIEERVSEAARILKLENLLDRKPKQLSGGQRQRVAIGRTIVRKPEVFLFDEPLSNLDAELRVEMRIEIAKLHEELGNTMIYVTHDQVEAMTMADKIVVLRDGNIEQVGSPLELYNHPRNQFVAGFIGSPKMNFLPVTVTEILQNAVTVCIGENQTATLPCNTDSLQVGEILTLGVRPEHFLAGGEADINLTVKVDAVEHLGGTTYVYSQFAGRSIAIEAESELELPRGQEVTFSFDHGRCHLFNSDEQSIQLEKTDSPEEKKAVAA